MSGPRVLIIIQNLWVPFDRRVWLECQALVASGYDVTVVCPKGPGDPAYQVIDGVTVHKYKAYAPGGSKVSFVWEYAYSFLLTLRLVFRARKAGKFKVMQACNPPDIFWPIAMLLRRLDGTKFVFDHHDLCPELFQSRFGGTTSLPYKGLRFLERTTHRTADHVTSTNDSYRRIAITRSGKANHDVTVVRTGPDPDKLQRDPAVADETLRRGHRYLVTYIGVMGPQDGVDIVIRAADHIVNNLGRKDIAFTLMGGGDSFDEVVALRDDLGLRDYIEFTGRVPDETVRAVMSTADIGLSPDPKNPLNDVSTMNKTMEYMAFELPVVAFDLIETKVSAADAAVYVEPNDVAQYGEAIVELLDDEVRRRRMGKLGRERVEQVLAWKHQQKAYLQVYDALTGHVSHLGDVARATGS
ncbi:glycosyltransferase involved in cell wall biosynthesis [Kribbella rubisoli]|uniref:Glycosyltransferase involved in cell wall biosynthesis n=1 Tax=Kribbella rubisoli TaxID=3075929 RepID=A0A4Q7WQS1_9ACTN|nr:glycosyltransferase family 4 protein [Kribbella rubisoli]RZU12223.1 glycosyltransferase involved in cell wall biosynthesis [Kribbella rubisoli]